MIKRLTKHGNSLALVIDRPILDLLGIDAATPLDLSTDGQSLFITPRRSAAREREFRRALTKGKRRYGSMLRRLADR